ncbi:hypothetical protein ACLB2K_031946 [Fragaria x ananassa]
MHRNLEEDIDCYMKLYEVLPRMEKTIERIRNQVLQDDYRSQNYSPVYGNHMRCLQEEIGKKFTRDIFLLIKEQINFESNFVIGQRGVHPTTGASLISLMQYGKPEKMWIVSYQPYESNPTFVCSCKLFESDGIPCCHIFAVMKFEMLTTLPESLIARYGDLMAQCAKICHMSSYSEERYDETREALSQLTVQSQKYWVEVSLKTVSLPKASQQPGVGLHCQIFCVSLCCPDAMWFWTSLCIVHGREIKCRFADGGNVKDLLTIFVATPNSGVHTIICFPGNWK